jgi:hypothetical protein
MPQKKTIAIIGADQPQYEKCCASLAKYALQRIPVEDGGVDTASLSQTTIAMLVFPGKTQSETLNICRQLRATSELSLIPLLLTVNRYDIVHGFVVRQTENAEILITPFTDQELRETIEQIALNANLTISL